MNTFKEMYPGKAYSPQTTIVRAIDSQATELEMIDEDALPAAPNIAVLGDESQAETILYTEKDGVHIRGLVRAVAKGDQALHWEAGSAIARNFTSFDLEAVQENIRKLQYALTEAPTSPVHVMAPTNLTERFAVEMDGDPWTWVQGRIRAGDYRGIHVGDYIPFQIGTATVIAEVAGINTYTGTGDIRTPNHIDFISRDLFNQLTQWNFATFSNGTAANPAPWMNSNMYAFLNGLAMEVPETTGLNPAMRAVDYSQNGVFPRLPEVLRAVIAPKRVMFPTRFSAAAIQTNDNGSAWMDIGHLWLPSEVEVTGTAQLSGSMLPASHFHSVRGFVQYPIFANSMQKRIKGMGHGGNPANWFTLSNQGGNASTIVNVNTQGVVNNTQPTSSMRLPICFRIA